MIPDSAMRPVGASNKASRSTKHAASSSQQSQPQQPLQVSAGSVEWEQFTGRLRTVTDRADEQVAARTAEAAYEQFVTTTQHKQLREVLEEKGSATAAATRLARPGRQETSGGADTDTATAEDGHAQRVAGAADETQCGR